MKKILFVIGVLFFVTTPSFALWNQIQGVFKKEVKTIDYTIDTSGVNPRVYEFDTQGVPKAHCIVVFRDDTKTSPTMFCFKK
jgi:hypothetical protein